MKSNWDHIDHYPPSLVRLLARRRTGKGPRSVVALSDAEIAIAADIPVARVRAMYNLRNWNGVTVGEMRAFFKGCKFDPLNHVDRNRAKAYGRVNQGFPSFTYLKNSPHWESVFEPLIEKAEKWMTTKS